MDSRICSEGIRVLTAPRKASLGGLYDLGVECCSNPRPEVLAKRDEGHWLIAVVRCGSCEWVVVPTVWKPAPRVAPSAAQIRVLDQLQIDAVRHAWSDSAVMWS